jgi:hypothetical protein
MSSKNYVLVAIAVASFVCGVVGQYFYPEALQRPSDFWFLGLFAFLIFAWYVFDTNQRAYRRTPMLNVCVVALAGIALPYYFFRSRGAKGGFIALALFVLAFLGSSALTIAGEYFAYHALQS